MATKAEERVKLIDAIVAASRKPLPEIRESFHLRHKVTGKTHSPFGMPFNFKAVDYEDISVGFAYVDANGTTYGTRAKTREELVERFEKHQDAQAKEFRAALEQQMNDAQLEEQAKYWLKQRQEIFKNGNA